MYVVTVSYPRTGAHVYTFWDFKAAWETFKLVKKLAFRATIFPGVA